MQSVTIALFLGCAALQEPPKPPESPRPQEPVREPKASSTLDADLRAAVESFKRVRSYRFKVDGHVTSPWTAPQDAQRDDNVAHAKERAAAGPAQEFKFDGICERELPLQIDGETIEAFRKGPRVAYRAKGGTWNVMSHLPALRGAGGDAPPGPDLRLLPIVARLPAPHELIDHLDTLVASCTRVADDKSTGMVTFDCLLKPDAGPRGEPAPIAAAGAKLRIVVWHGAIDDLSLELRPPLAASGAAASATPPRPAEKATGAQAAASGANDSADTAYHYKLTNYDDARVEVPEEVARLLEQ